MSNQFCIQCGFKITNELYFYKTPVDKEYSIKSNGPYCSNCSAPEGTSASINLQTDKLPQLPLQMPLAKNDLLNDINNLSLDSIAFVRLLSNHVTTDILHQVKDYALYTSKLEKKIIELEVVIDTYDSKATKALNSKCCEKHQAILKEISFEDFTQKIFARGCIWCLEDKLKQETYEEN